MPCVEVAAAILICGREVWVQRREEGVHLAGSWEFPGGKLEKDESALSCLLREVAEETGCVLDPTTAKALEVMEHAYVDRVVRIHFFLCRIKEKASVCAEGRWVPLSELSRYELPPANRRVVKRLMDSSKGRQARD